MRAPIRDSALAGREREQELLATALVRARNGSGGMVLMGGEAGIGKTTLASWLEDLAVSQGLTVLSGSCFDLQTTPPFGPWRDALWRHRRKQSDQSAVQASNGRYDATMSADFDRFEVIQAEIEAIAADGPVLITLEDIHWADYLSLYLLRMVSRRARDTGIVILATYRTGASAPEHDLQTMLPPIVRESAAERIDLRPLSNATVLDILDEKYSLGPSDRSRLMQHVTVRAEGNPFLLGEVLRELEAGRILFCDGQDWTLADITHVPVPPLVRQIVGRRVSGLDTSSQTMLGLASVIGYTIPLDLWQTVGGCDDAEFECVVRQALDSQLLIQQPGNLTVRFQHALVREALYESLTPVRKRHWHRKVAETLLVSSSSDPHELGHHFRVCGDPRALQWLTRAGIAALKS